MRVELFNNIESLHNARKKKESHMTPEQRLELAFQLIDLAIAVSPTGKLTTSKKDNISWIELRLKDDTD